VTDAEFQQIGKKVLQLYRQQGWWYYPVGGCYMDKSEDIRVYGESELWNMLSATAIALLQQEERPTNDAQQ
jgi:hypothetical protein